MANIRVASLPKLDGALRYNDSYILPSDKSRGQGNSLNTGVNNDNIHLTVRGGQSSSNRSQQTVNQHRPPRDSQPSQIDDSSIVTARKIARRAASSDVSNVADMICIGMGPASLAIGIAAADAYSKLPCNLRRNPHIKFLERQNDFAWHSGMQIPDAKMQISFLKDLAMPRNPTSPFTFVNYLHQKGRFSQFLNLDTFLPTRLEYEDYMRWCAEPFAPSATFGAEVMEVKPQWTTDGLTVNSFAVSYRDYHDGSIHRVKARHVVIAAGGKPSIPPQFAAFSTSGIPSVLPIAIHSSQYMKAIKQFSANSCQIGPGRFAVVGSGQSAAEIFMDLCSRFPMAEVTMLCRAESLKPSDDSPFVNEIFDPEQTAQFHAKDAEARQEVLRRNKATNYSVVRSELIERIYSHLYMQNFIEPEVPRHNRRHRILFNTEVAWAECEPDGETRRENEKQSFKGTESVMDQNNDESSSHTAGKSDHGNRILSLQLTGVAPMQKEAIVDKLSVSHIFLATGYVRNTHENILKDTLDLMDKSQVAAQQTRYPIGRDYRLQLDTRRVPPEQCGIWLQGCNESTHGLSDSLLSVLAVRGGEIVDSIFAEDIQEQKTQFNIE